MADPTTETIFAGARASGGRISPVRNEVLRYLASVMPGVIDYANTQTGDEDKTYTIPQFEKFYSAREPVDAYGFPACIVGMSMDSEPLTPLVNYPVITCIVYAVRQRIETREENDDLWDLGDLVKLAMHAISSSWCLPDGRTAWSSCKYRSTSQIPLDWKQYAGVGVEFGITAAGIDLWNLPQT